MDNTASVRAWLLACPPIAESTGLFGSDYLQDDPGGFTLDSVPSSLKYVETITGEYKLKSEQEQLYVLAARMDYGPEAVANLNNLDVFRQIFAWIIEKNNARDLPAWEGGELTAIVPSLTAYPIAMGSSAARYQIQLKALYKVG